MADKSDARRKYPRVKAPKELHVAWKSSGQQDVSRAETIAMGGLFLYTRNPPTAGSMVELMLDFSGGSIRARAVVRHCTPGKGMGIQFVQITPENRAKLNQFLIKHSANSGDGVKFGAKVHRNVASEPRATHDAFSQEPQVADQVVSEPSQQQFDTELANMLTTARRGNHYQLLGVASDSPADQIKQRFYILARKFHPDHHMAKAESIASLKDLMGSLTTAYKTLTDRETRAKYDRKLHQSGGFDLHRNKTESQTVLEESLARAKEYIRAENFIGSIVWLRKCVEMAPQDPAYHTMLARSLGKVVQYRQDAIAHFQKAIEIDPWKLDSYLQLAELYEEMELPSQALSVYSKILNIDPVHAVARDRRSKISSTPATSSSR